MEISLLDANESAPEPEPEPAPEALVQRQRVLLMVLGSIIAFCLAGLAVTYIRFLQTRRMWDTVARATQAGDDVFLSDFRRDASLLPDLEEALGSDDDRLRADACLVLARYFYAAELFSDKVEDFSQFVLPLAKCAAGPDVELRRRAALATSILYVPSVKWSQYWKQPHDLTDPLMRLVADKDEGVRLGALAGLRVYESFDSNFLGLSPLRDSLPSLKALEQALELPGLTPLLRERATPAPLQLYLMELMRARGDPRSLPVMLDILDARASEAESLIQIRIAATALDILLGCGPECVVPLIAKARLTDSAVVRAACVDGLVRLVEDSRSPSLLSLKGLLAETFRRVCDSEIPFVRLRALKGLAALDGRIDAPNAARGVVASLGETLSALNRFGSEIERARAAGWDRAKLRELAGLKASLCTVAVSPSPVEVYDRLLADQLAVLNALDPRGSAPFVVREVRRVLDENQGLRLSLALDDPPDGPLQRFLFLNAGPDLVPLLAEIVKVKNGPLVYWACRALRERKTPADAGVLGYLINHLDYRELAPWVVSGLERWISGKDVDPASLRETGVPGAGGRPAWDRARVEEKVATWRDWWKQFQADRRVIITPHESAGSGDGPKR